jgi:hypothetical protein
VLPPVSELAQAIAETAEEFVERCRDERLDYSEASLAIVEALLAEAHDFGGNARQLESLARGAGSSRIRRRLFLARAARPAGSGGR